MMTMALSKTEMGVSFHQGNGTLSTNYRRNLSLSFGLSISRRPAFAAALTAKKAKANHLVGLRTRSPGPVHVVVKSESANRSIDGGILQKEFEFNPSFGEYLKVLESSRTGKEKRGTPSLKRLKSKDEVKTRENTSPSTLPSVGEGRSNRLQGLDGQSHEGSVSAEIENEERVSTTMKDENKMGFGKKGNAGISKENERREPKNVKLGFVVKGDAGARGAIDSVQGRLRGKESEKELNLKKKIVLDHRSRRWTNKQTTSMQKSQQSAELESRSSKVDKSSYKSNEVGPKFGRNFSQVQSMASDKISVEKVKSTWSRNSLAQNNYEEMEMERAAFNSLKESSDIVYKPRVPRMETEERIYKLAKCLNGADIDMPEWMFSKMMQSAKIRFSDYSIVRVIQVLGRMGNWRRVLQLVEWLQLRDRFKSHKMRHIYTTALDVLGKARRPVEALNLFLAMQQQMCTYPDLVAYHCIAVTLGQAGHMKELFEVIDCMHSWPKKKFKMGILEKWDPRLEPDIVVYNAVLNACVQRKQWEGAFWVLQQLKQQGKQPSGTTFGLVMEVMYACGRYNLVHDFFKKVQKPNALAYNVIVKTLWKEGKIDKAISAVEEMERRGVVGSAALYYDLARCLCSAGRVQEALIQVEKICRVATKPLVVTYTGLIQACLEAGNIQDGLYIFKHMNKFCSPNLVTYNIMLKALLEHGMYREAKELLEKMLGYGNSVSDNADQINRVIPDSYTFNTMLDACIADQQWDDFEYIFEQMLHYEYHFNAKRHLKMIMEAYRAGKGKPLETTWKQLVRKGRTPPPLLAKEMFCMRLEQGDCTAALSAISSCCSSELPIFSCRAWLSFFNENAHRLQNGTLVELLRESSILIAGSDSRHLALKNLIASCREFLNSQKAASEIHQSAHC